MEGVKQINEEIKLRLLALLQDASLGKEKNQQQKQRKSIALVLDKRLVGIISMLVEFSVLQDAGVEKIFTLSSERASTSCSCVVYLTRPRPSHMKMLASHIQSYQKDGQVKSYHLILVPHLSLVCERMLEEEAIFGDIVIRSLPMDMVVLDDDVITLFQPDILKDYLLDEDYTTLTSVSRSLISFQNTFGNFGQTIGKGTAAKVVREVMSKMMQQDAAGSPNTKVRPGPIQTLILLDRETDLITPLLTQLTYEGLLDEIFKIKFNSADVDGDLIGRADQKGKKVKVPLHGTTEVYPLMRDMNFTIVPTFLSRVTRDCMQDKEQLSAVANKDPAVLRALLRQATLMEALTIHVNLAGFISHLVKEDSFHKRLEVEQSMLTLQQDQLVDDFIEECLHKKEPLMRTLRLLCLKSLTTGGLPTKKFDFFRREFLQTYGYDSLFTLNHLAKAGLFKEKPQENQKVFASAKKAFKLLVDKIDESNPTDIAFTYSGYAPLSVRLVHHALLPFPGKPAEEALRLLPGPFFDERDPRIGASSHSDGPRQVMVCFIGGVTFCELAALRFLGKQLSPPVKFVVVTTSMINGDSLLESFLDDPVRANG